MMLMGGKIRVLGAFFESRGYSLLMAIIYFKEFLFGAPLGSKIGLIRIGFFT